MTRYDHSRARARVQGITVSPAAIVAGVLLASALAFAAAMVMPAPARAQSGPTSLSTGGAATPVLPPFARTRSIIQAQNASRGPRAASGGPELDKIYENYLNSIGKGGAGGEGVSLSAGPGSPD